MEGKWQGPAAHIFLHLQLIRSQVLCTTSLQLTILAWTELINNQKLPEKRVWYSCYYRDKVQLRCMSSLVASSRAWLKKVAAQVLLTSCELNCNPQVLDDESWIESRRQVFTVLVFNCVRCKDRLITGCCWCTLKAFLFGGYGKQSSPSIRDRIWVWLLLGWSASFYYYYSHFPLISAYLARVPLAVEKIWQCN